VSRELGKLGAELEEDGDVLVVHGGASLVGAVVDTYDDHRMAMALSSLAAVVPGVVVSDPGCVRKTYPCYWRDAAALGMRFRIPA
jgi:3-phosphoshikimate 1-carboxyvinyltransferase